MPISQTDPDASMSAETGYHAKVYQIANSAKGDGFRT